MCKLIAPSIPLLTILVACVPNRAATFAPVDREVERRLGVGVSWHDAIAPAVPAAVGALLSEPLDRDAAIRVALASNRRLQARFDELGIAASELASATVLPPTEIEVSRTWALGQEHGESEIDVIQDVTALIEMPRRRGVARADLAAARARAVAAILEIAAAAEGAWIDMVAATQELELRRLVFHAAEAAAALGERMHEAGNTTALALAREREQREQARIELGRAEARLAQRRAELEAVLGLASADIGWRVIPRLPEPPEQAPDHAELEHRAVTASLELTAAHADADAAAGRLALARTRAWLPELGVGVSVGRANEQWEAGPAIRIGLPIFDQNQGPRARARAELHRARNLELATEGELRAQARAAGLRVRDTHAEVRQLRDVVLPLRQQILDEALAHYNAMNASTFELLTARRELIDAGSQYIDALRRFWRAESAARTLARGGWAPGTTGEPATTTTSSRQEGH